MGGSCSRFPASACSTEHTLHRPSVATYLSLNNNPGAPMLTIALTLLVTLIAVVLALNLHTPEKEIKHQVEHCHAIQDPQFRREMGALLGPAIIPGNTVQALHNGAE